jgi:hypothetical protein
MEQINEQKTVMTEKERNKIEKLKDVLFEVITNEIRKMRNEQELIAFFMT